MENNKLGSSIAVMNAKGGVGKSTVTLAIAETLSYYYGKKVLVIDSDAQMSISVMLMPFDELNQKRAKWKTLVGLLHQTLILEQKPDWKTFTTPHVSDVDDTLNIDLLPGDLRLTLVERAVTEADRHEQMRGLVRSVLAEARLKYDYVFIDCPPGLSLLTEIWLREADYHIAPVKPDFLAIAGLEMFREFKKINPDLKMAQNLGILVNMKNRNSAEDETYHDIWQMMRKAIVFPMPFPIWLLFSMRQGLILRAVPIRRNIQVRQGMRSAIRSMNSCCELAARKKPMPWPQSKKLTQKKMRSRRWSLWKRPLNQRFWNNQTLKLWRLWSSQNHNLTKIQSPSKS